VQQAERISEMMHFLCEEVKDLTPFRSRIRQQRGSSKQSGYVSEERLKSL